MSPMSKKYVLCWPNDCSQNTIYSFLQTFCHVDSTFMKIQGSIVMGQIKIKSDWNSVAQLFTKAIPQADPLYGARSSMQCFVLPLTGSKFYFRFVSKSNHIFSPLDLAHLTFIVLWYSHMLQNSQIQTGSKSIAWYHRLFSLLIDASAYKNARNYYKWIFKNIDHRLLWLLKYYDTMKYMNPDWITGATRIATFNGQVCISRLLKNSFSYCVQFHLSKSF